MPRRWTRITRQDYFKVHGSRGGVKPKLTDRSMRYAIRQLEKCHGIKVVAEELNVTQRSIQRLWAQSTARLVRVMSSGPPAGPPARRRRAGDPDGTGHLQPQARGRGAPFQEAAQGWTAYKPPSRMRGNEAQGPGGRLCWRGQTDQAGAGASAPAIPPCGAPAGMP